MTGWAGQSVIAVSLLVAAVLLLRRPVARTFGARAAYALWLAPLLRAILPPLPAATRPALGAGQGAVDWAMAIGDRALGQATPGAAVDPWLALWLAGAAIYLAAQLVRHHLFLTRALRVGQPLTRDDVACDLVASRAVDGPMATGLIHPLILVPHDFQTRFTPEQQRLALLHEQLHHQRGDLWAAAAAMVLTALLWFNPLAHLALGAFRRDMEAACDASLLGHTGDAAAPAYAETILRCAMRPVPRSLCALTSVDELKGRLTMLNIRSGLAGRVAGLGIATALTGLGLALAAPVAAQDAAPAEKKVIKIIKVDKHKPGAAPVGEERDIILRGPDGRIDEKKLEELGVKCDGRVTEIADEGGTDKDKRKFFIKLCGKPGETGAQQVAALERAKAEILKNDDMPAEMRARVGAKLDEAIARAKAEK